MKLNSDTAFNLLAVAFMVILLGTFMLEGWLGYPLPAFVITCIIIALIGDFAAMMLLLKYSKEQNEVTDGFNIDEVNVPRTAMSTSIEVLAGLIVALSWMISAKNGLFSDNDGSFSYGTLFGMLLASGAIIFMLWDAYSPGLIENVGKLTNIKQVKLAIAKNRLFAVLLAVGMLFSSFPELRRSWMWDGLAAILVVAFAMFRILIRRARD